METPLNTLIADDHTLFAEGVELILKEIPFIKVTGKVSNGQEALRYLNGHKTDLVMMDINMPVMNGVEALREIKKSFPWLKSLSCPCIMNNKPLLMS